MFSAYVHLYGLNWPKLKVCRERVSHLMSYSLEVSCTTPAGSSNVCVVNEQQTHISNMKQQGCGLLSSFSKGVMEFGREVWHPRPREEPNSGLLMGHAVKVTQIQHFEHFIFGSSLPSETFEVLVCSISAGTLFTQKKILQVYLTFCDVIAEMQTSFR